MFVSIQIFMRNEERSYYKEIIKTLFPGFKAYQQILLIRLFPNGNTTATKDTILI